jgi:hypothetical protein
MREEREQRRRELQLYTLSRPPLPIEEERAKYQKEKVRNNYHQGQGVAPDEPQLPPKRYDGLWQSTKEAALKLPHIDSSIVPRSENDFGGRSRSEESYEEERLKASLAQLEIRLNQTKRQVQNKFEETSKAETQMVEPIVRRNGLKRGVHLTRDRYGSAAQNAYRSRNVLWQNAPHHAAERYPDQERAREDYVSGAGHQSLRPQRRIREETQNDRSDHYNYHLQQQQQQQQYQFRKREQQLFRKHEQNILKKQEEERQRHQQQQLQEISRTKMNDLPPDQPAYMRHMKDSFGARQTDPSNATPRNLVAGDENSIQTSRTTSPKGSSYM